MQVNIKSSWKEKLKGEFKKQYFLELTDFLKKEYEEGEEGIVYPAQRNIFRAFDRCSFEKVKVVILGQDPYHGVGQANGLAFSVDEKAKLPPSLKNIFKEIEDDPGEGFSAKVRPFRKVGPLPELTFSGISPRSGDLTYLAEQGVLLLNATLTVRAHQPGSHQKMGWELFTDKVIQVLSEERVNLVFMLWGNYAKKKGAHIDRNKHLVLEALHPSPFSAYSGFFGCKHFSKANAYLLAHSKTPLNWL